MVHNLTIINADSALGNYFVEAAEVCSFDSPTVVYIPDADPLRADAYFDSFLSGINKIPAQPWAPQAVVISLDNSPRTSLRERKALNLTSSGIIVTILRLPEFVFGDGIGGTAENMFRQVISGRFIAVRNLNPTRRAICALDVARIAYALAPIGGSYHISDGHEHSITDIAEAMWANTGKFKRILHIPDKWAKFIAGVGDHLPIVGQYMNSKILADRHRNDSSISPSEQLPELPFTPFNAVEVLARTAKDYPYKESQL